MFGRQQNLEPCGGSKNSGACSRALLDTLSRAKHALAAHSYTQAAEKFEQVVTGLSLLYKTDPERYGAPLYANQYTLAQLYLFGLHNTSKGTVFLKAACAQAEACGADRDCTVMTDVLDVLKTEGVTGVLREFGIVFPENLLD